PPIFVSTKTDTYETFPAMADFWSRPIHPFPADRHIYSDGLDRRTESVPIRGRWDRAVRHQQPVYEFFLPQHGQHCCECQRRYRGRIHLAQKSGRQDGPEKYCLAPRKRYLRFFVRIGHHDRHHWLVGTAGDLVSQNRPGRGTPDGRYVRRDAVLP